MESYLEWHWRLTLTLGLRLIPLWLLVVSSTPVCLRLAFMLCFQPHYNTVQHKNFAEVYFADWWFFLSFCSPFLRIRMTEISAGINFCGYLFKEQNGRFNFYFTLRWVTVHSTFILHIHHCNTLQRKFGIELLNCCELDIFSAAHIILFSMMRSVCI